MTNARIARVLGLVVTTILGAGVGRAQVFGTQDYNRTKVPAVAFTGATFNISGSVGRFGTANVDQHFYAPLDIPSGAIVDYIGFNNFNDGTPSVMVANILQRTASGSVGVSLAVGNTAHADWQTDLNASPFGAQLLGDNGQILILDVEITASPNLQFFGWVEVWWKRSVGDFHPQVFTDVPPSHPYYTFIQALAASGITGGCGGGNYCPDNPVSRGQMAVFLAKALGLHWPN